MPPTGRTATEHLGIFLARSVQSAQTGLVLCSVGWITLGSWVAFGHPVRLGPGRLIVALALVVATAACPLVWWFARSWQRWLMIVITDLIPLPNDNTHPGGNLHSVANRR